MTGDQIVDVAEKGISAPAGSAADADIFLPSFMKGGERKLLGSGVFLPQRHKRAKFHQNNNVHFFSDFDSGSNPLICSPAPVRKKSEQIDIVTKKCKKQIGILEGMTLSAGLTRYPDFI